MYRALVLIGLGIQLRAGKNMSNQNNKTIHTAIAQQEGNGPKDERASMEMASKVKFDFRFEICDLNYPNIHVHIESNSHFHGL